MPSDETLFCSEFDATLARQGPAAIFLWDRDDALRLDEMWTRDVWGRAPGPHATGWRWTLLRDHDTGYVALVLATSPTLLTAHPRADVRAFTDLDEARSAREQYGQPPICSEPW